MLDTMTNPWLTTPMNEIATQTFKNFQRHFIVWGLVLSAFFFIPHFADKPSVSRPLPTGSPAYQIARCTPANDGPIDYALIQRVGAGVERVHSDRLIGKALDDALGGKDWKNVRILGFCR